MGIPASTDPKIRERYEIERLQENYGEMFRLKVLGLKNVDIARILGYSQTRISHIMNSELAKVRIGELQAERDSGTTEVSQRLAALGTLAVEEIEKILNGTTGSSPSDKLRAAFGVLSSSPIGLGPVTKQQVTTNVEHYLVPADIEDIKRRARAAGILAVKEETEAQTIDVENELKEIGYEEVSSSTPGNAPVPAGVGSSGADGIQS